MKKSLIWKLDPSASNFESSCPTASFFDLWQSVLFSNENLNYILEYFLESNKQGNKRVNVKPSTEFIRKKSITGEIVLSVLWISGLQYFYSHRPLNLRVYIQLWVFFLIYDKKNWAA